MHHINPTYITIKKVIRKATLADAFICARYGFSPYQACEHGCMYCDGRAEKYYVLVIKTKYVAYQIAMIILGLGSLFLCYLFFKTKLIPR